MEMDKDVYFSQFEILNAFEVNKNVELYRVKLTLHSPISQYPKYSVCKIIKNFMPKDLKEVEMMKKFCCSGKKGIIKYYHHLQLNHLYIFIEDCYKYKSGFEDICINRRKFKYENDKLSHSLLKKVNFYNTQANQLMEALDYIHQSGYIHCDIAPSNILLSKNMDYRLADFGAMVEINNFISTTTAIYLSPDNYKKYTQGILVKAIPEVDNFALAKSLFEMLILENQINIARFSNIFYFCIFMKAEINSRHLDTTIYDTIISIKNHTQSESNFKSISSIPKFSSKTHQSSTYFTETSYCNSCGNIGYLLRYENKNNEDLIMFKCSHTYHLYCFSYMVRNLKIPRFICPICQTFIGETNYEQIMKHTKLFPK